MPSQLSIPAEHLYYLGMSCQTALPAWHFSRAILYYVLDVLLDCSASLAFQQSNIILYFRCPARLLCRLGISAEQYTIFQMSCQTALTARHFRRAILNFIFDVLLDCSASSAFQQSNIILYFRKLSIAAEQFLHLIKECPARLPSQLSISAERLALYFGMFRQTALPAWHYCRVILYFKNVPLYCLAS